jgi:prepilin-type N-terminal cleavage/methylation domain-containing protein
MSKKLSSKGFGAIEVLVAIVVIAVIGFGGYLVWHNHQDKKATDNTKSQTSTTNKTANNPTNTTISTTDGKVSVTLPNTWHVVGDKQIISVNTNTHLCDKYNTSNCSAVAPCLDTDDTMPCIYEADFQPKTFNSTTGQQWHLSVEKTTWTNDQAAFSLLGELNAQNTVEQSRTPINGYDAYYVKVGSNGSSVGDYTDIHYFIEKDGYLVHFSNREKFNGKTGSSTDTWDNSAYSSDFASIVKSLKLNL